MKHAMDSNDLTIIKTTRFAKQFRQKKGQMRQYEGPNGQRLSNELHKMQKDFGFFKEQLNDIIKNTNSFEVDNNTPSFFRP